MEKSGGILNYVGRKYGDSLRILKGGYTLSVKIMTQCKNVCRASNVCGVSNFGRSTIGMHKLNNTIEAAGFLTFLCWAVWLENNCFIPMFPRVGISISLAISLMSFRHFTCLPSIGPLCFHFCSSILVFLILIGGDHSPIFMYIGQSSIV